MPPLNPHVHMRRGTTGSGNPFCGGGGGGATCENTVSVVLNTIRDNMKMRMSNVPNIDVKIGGFSNGSNLNARERYVYR